MCQLDPLQGPAVDVLTTMRSKLESFQEHIPLITALRNPGMRKRHWDKISTCEHHAWCRQRGCLVPTCLAAFFLSPSASPTSVSSVVI